jgi:hypothetical protein
MLDPSTFEFDQQAPLAVEVLAERAQFDLSEPSQEILNLLKQLPSPVPLES